jgi:hypothetical protein
VLQFGLYHVKEDLGWRHRRLVQKMIAAHEELRYSVMRSLLLIRDVG